MRCKYYVDIPVVIPNEQLSDILVSECKKFEATWISETQAVFSSNDDEKNMRKIFKKYGIIIKNRKDDVKHTVDKKGKEHIDKIIKET
tara:strand:- start:82 stop:345 length:264 start_codon:yes stop_codon:yes gene_type:complete